MTHLVANIQIDLEIVFFFSFYLDAKGTKDQEPKNASSLS